MRLCPSLHLLLGAFLALLLTSCQQEEGRSSAAATSAEARVDSVADPAPAPRFEQAPDDRSVERRMKDATTAARVRIAFGDERVLRPYDLQAQVYDGRLVLEGDVQSRTDRERAAQIAREVEGVSEIDNEILVQGRQVAEAEPEPEAESQPDTTSEELADAADPSEDEEAPAEEEPSSEESSAVYHTVQSGQSLWTISRRYGVSISQIKELNGLRSNNLQPGDRLRIK